MRLKYNFNKILGSLTCVLYACGQNVVSLSGYTRGNIGRRIRAQSLPTLLTPSSSFTNQVNPSMSQLFPELRSCRGKRKTHDITPQ